MPCRRSRGRKESDKHPPRRRDKRRMPFRDPQVHCHLAGYPTNRLKAICFQAANFRHYQLSENFPTNSIPVCLDVKTAELEADRTTQSLAVGGALALALDLALAGFLLAPRPLHIGHQSQSESSCDEALSQLGFLVRILRIDMTQPMLKRSPHHSTTWGFSDCAQIVALCHRDASYRSCPAYVYAATYDLL